MTKYIENIEKLAIRFNVAKADLNYLLAHEGSPGTTELLAAPIIFDYFGSLAEHECHMARLAEVTDDSSFVAACLLLRTCGYADPTVIEKVNDAARVVGDHNLLEAIEGINDQDVLLDTILNGYGVGNQQVMVLQMDGSLMVRIPSRMLGLEVAA